MKLFRRTNKQDNNLQHQEREEVTVKHSCQRAMTSAEYSTLCERAGDPNTSTEDLHEMANNRSISEPIKRYIAENPNTSSDTLCHLLMTAKNPREMKRSVADNPNCPQWLLKDLSQDKDAAIRQAVADNQQASVELLTALSTDEDPLVRVAALANPTFDTAHEHLNRDDRANLWGIAENPTTPPSVLTDLAKDATPITAYGLLVNPSTPAEAVNQIGEMLAAIEDFNSTEEFEETRQALRRLRGNKLTTGRTRELCDASVVWDEARWVMKGYSYPS